MRKALLALPLVVGALGMQAQRSIQLDDLERFKEVSAPEVSPDGKWVLYTVSMVNKEADHRESQLWEVSWDGSETIPLTTGKDEYSEPHWSPDGRYISFISSRAGAAKGSQIWVLDRRGGEAHQLTALHGRLRAYEWSPDAKRIALTFHQGSTEDAESGGRAARTGADAAGAPDLTKPFVEDRYAYKRDAGLGFVANDDHARIYLYSLETGKAEPLTAREDVDESSPAWSHDGRKIAFVSNRDKDPDRTHNTQIYVAEARPGAEIHALTTNEAVGPRLSWSKDDQNIAYTVGSETRYNFHSLSRLAIVPAAGGPRRVLTESLDRGVNAPEYSEHGKWITFLVADDLSSYPARVSAAGGPVEKLAGRPVVVTSWSVKAGHQVVAKADDDHPAEIFALEGQTFRPLTKLNEKLLAELKLAPTEAVSFKSKDGSEVHGLLMRPPDFVAGRRYPALIRIHGGPTAQDEHAFQFERQWFAAHGYLVLAVNYRGSSGRGAQWTQAIYQDWGHKDVEDILAGADYIVQAGLADPQRLGIGGWSYGGVLTDYVIASDTRFRAAISGAGSANHISLYGHDQYTYLYDNEFGQPWKNPDLWLKISYPFFKADKITTPTLFMGGLNDSNVPILGGEQLYQALKSLDVPTELVVYPNQNHGFTSARFIRDRYERYLAWYDRFLQPTANASASSTSGALGEHR